MVCVVDGVLLRPLPYPEPERLAVVRSVTRGETQPWNSSPPDFRAFRDGAGAFEQLGAYYDIAANLMLDGEPVRLSAARASAGMFPLLGVRPLLGRAFRADEEVAGADRVVLLSHALWRNRFGGSPAVLGSSVTLDGAPYTVVGVMPASFRFPDRSAELWLPMAFAPGDVLDTRGNYFLNVVGRLRPGVSIERARADLDRIAARVAAEDPEAPLRGTDGRPLARRSRRRHPSRAAPPARGRRPPPGHHLRQRRRPAAGPRRGASPRARAAGRAGRDAARAWCASSSPRGSC